MTPERMERMSVLIAEIGSQAKAHKETNLNRIRDFLNYWSQFQIDQVTSGPSRFNVVEQSGLYSDERQHSAILAWLLDARSSHSQGNAFLYRFAQMLGLQLKGDAGAYTVRPEFPGLESIADVVVFRKGDVLIYIENKTFADEGEEQLGRQERDMRRWSYGLGVPEARRFAVFLTPQGRVPTSGDAKAWRTLSYVELSDGLESVVDSITDAKLRCFVQDWLSLLKKLKVALC
jgi:hypothetical protein